MANSRLMKSLIANILDNFVHNVREYDRVYMDDKTQSKVELAETGVKETSKIRKNKRRLNGKSVE